MKQFRRCLFFLYFRGVPALLRPEFGPALQVPQYTPQSPLCLPCTRLATQAAAPLIIIIIIIIPKPTPTLQKGDPTRPRRLPHTLTNIIRRPLIFVSLSFLPLLQTVDKPS